MAVRYQALEESMMRDGVLKKFSVDFTSVLSALTFLSMGHCNVFRVPGSDVR